MARAFRGSGVRFTLPFVFRFLGLWMAVTVLIVLVFGITSYLLLGDRLAAQGREGIALGILIAQTVITILAVAALGVFTTHRLAGPIIALQRAFEDVKGGDLERRLRFRQADSHLRGVETSFNEMVDTLKTRIEREPAPAAQAR
jgi:methyl-accepting chemotaxis protein